MPRRAVAVRGCRSSAGGLEEFDQVAGRVGEQDLASAGAGDDVAKEGQTRVAEPSDLGIDVVEDEVDAIAAPAVASSSGVARAPELAGPDSRSRRGPRTTSAKAGTKLVFTVKPRWVV